MSRNYPKMLLDVLTLALIIHYGNEFAAKQLLTELTHRICDDHHFPKSKVKNPTFEYQRLVILRACKLAGPHSEAWLQGLYDG